MSSDKDADPMSSLDRHLVELSTTLSVSKCKGVNSSNEVGRVREAHGLCPSCGQQLFRLEAARKGFLSCCFFDDDPVRKVPLTIPNLVENGICLTCKDGSTGIPRLSLAETASSWSSDASSRSGFLPDECSLPSTSTMDRDSGSVSVATSPEDDSFFLHDIMSMSLQRTTSPSAWLPAGTAVYQGPYNERGQRHGQGEMVWSNGDVYRGAFVCDMRQGHGTLTFSPPQDINNAYKDGGEYVGDWYQDHMQGNGTRRYANGDVYMGEYRAGVRHGDGRFYYANGDLYWGKWQNNQMHGQGRYYYASGQRFEGLFLCSKRAGKGKLQRTDGTIEIFQYVNDQRVGQGIRWSADRSKAWRLWMPSNAAKGAPLQKQKISIAEAVSLDYDIEQAAQGCLEGQSWAT